MRHSLLIYLIILSLVLLILPGCRVDEGPDLTPTTVIPTIESSQTPLPRSATQPETTNTAPPFASPIPPTSTYAPLGRAPMIMEAANRNFDAGNWIGAINDYSLAILEDPGFAEAYLRRALAYIQFGELQAAAIDLDRSVALDPFNVEGWVVRAELKGSQGLFDSAFDDLRHAEEVDKDYPRLYLVRGRLYIKQGLTQERFNAAFLDFQTLAILAPDQADGYLERGKLYLAAGEPDLALIDLNIALAIEPDKAESLHIRGETYLVLDRVSDATLDLEAAYALDYRPMELLLSLSNTYLLLGRYEEAIEILSEAERRSQTEPRLYLQRGIAYLLSSQTYGALVDANRALTLRPDYVEALSLRGTVYLNFARWNDAIRDFERAYSLDSTYIDALYGIAQAKYALGDVSGSEEALEQYLSIAEPRARNYTAVQVFLGLIRGEITPITIPTAVPSLDQATPIPTLDFVP